MPGRDHVAAGPRKPVYEIRFLRTSLRMPVQRRALTFLRREAPGFLQQWRDEQPHGEVHYRFWQRGGGYDRNITDSTTLHSMIEYLHHNPVRRGLVAQATDWPWSSARFYARRADALLSMDPAVEFM